MGSVGEDILGRSAGCTRNWEHWGTHFGAAGGVQPKLGSMGAFYGRGECNRNGGATLFTSTSPHLPSPTHPRPAYIIYSTRTGLYLHLKQPSIIRARYEQRNMLLIPCLTRHKEHADSSSRGHILTHLETFGAHPERIGAQRGRKGGWLHVFWKKCSFYGELCFYTGL